MCERAAETALVKLKEEEIFFLCVCGKSANCVNSASDFAAAERRRGIQ